MYKSLMEISREIGVSYFMLRDMAAAGTIPAIRKGEKGRWKAISEEVADAIKTQFAIKK